MRFLLSIFGAIVGSFFGMPGLGFALGSLAGQYFFPETQEGPRLDDLTAQTSAYGAVIPLVAGTIEVTGNLIWLKNNAITEVATTERIGFLGPKVTTYEYFFTGAFGLCEGPIGGVVQVTADNKPVLQQDFNLLEQAILDGWDAVFGIKSKDYLKWTVYDGGPGQMPSPLMQAELGAANVSADLGLAKIEFEDFPLEDYGNRIPTFKFVVYMDATLQSTYTDFNTSVGSTSGHLDTRRMRLFTNGADTVYCKDYLKPLDVWITDLGYLRPTTDAVGSVLAVDKRGDVYVELRIDFSSGYSSSAIAKLNGATGALMWVGDLDFVVGLNTYQFYYPAAIVAKQGLKEYLVFDGLGLYGLGVYNISGGMDPVPIAALASSGGDIHGLTSDKNGRIYILRHNPTGHWDISFDLVDQIVATSSGQVLGTTQLVDIEGLYPATVPTRPQTAKLLVYDPDTHRILISVSSYTWIYDIASASLTEILDGSTSFGSNGGSEGFQEIENSIFWLNKSSFWTYEIDFVGQTLLRKLNWYDQWGDTTLRKTALFDYREDAFLMFSSSYGWRKYWLDRPAQGPELLSTVIKRWAGSRIGYVDADHDVSLLGGTHIVRGAKVGRQMSARAALQPLFARHAVDPVQVDGQIRYVPRGSQTPRVIAESDMNVRAGNSGDFPGWLEEVIGQEVEMPHVLHVEYINAELNYETDTAEAKRSKEAVNTDEIISVQVPLVLTVDEAAQLAEIMLYTYWIERVEGHVTLLPEHRDLIPTDVITVSRGGVSYTLRLTQVDMGEAGVVTAKGAPLEAASYTSTATGTLPPRDPVIVAVSPWSGLFLFDTPALTDDEAGDAGFYLAVYPEDPAQSWPGAMVVQSLDEILYQDWQRGDVAPTHGVLMAAFPPPVSCWSWDNVSALTYKAIDGVPETKTVLEVLNGANACFIGSSAAGWEIARFTTALDNGDGTWTLTGWLRGKRGTEAMAATAWASGSRIVIPVDSSLMWGTQDLSSEAWYFAETIGGDDNSDAAEGFTFPASNMKPYAPVHIAGSRDGGNNLTATWVRRTRLDGQWRDGTTVKPLSEDSEEYEVDYVDGSGAVLRSLTGLASETAGYTAAEQTADGLTPGDPVNIKVYQISALVGRGYEGAATI